MKNLLFLISLTISLTCSAQEFSELKKYEPTEEYDNIHVQKIAEDEFQSVFIIWVKNNVKEHYHANHSENIVVLEGEAVMTLGDQMFLIKKGDYLNIPKGTQHSITQITSETPLKVLSIQSPLFKGEDRVFMESKN